MINYRSLSYIHIHLFSDASTAPATKDDRPGGKKSSYEARWDTAVMMTGSCKRC